MMSRAAQTHLAVRVFEITVLFVRQAFALSKPKLKNRRQIGNVVKEKNRCTKPFKKLPSILASYNLIDKNLFVGLVSGFDKCHCIFL